MTAPRMSERLSWQDRILLDADVSHLGVRVALLIARAMDRTTGEARISQATLAKHLKCTERAVQKATRALSPKYLAVQTREIGTRAPSTFGPKAFGGRGGANIYRLVIERTNEGSSNDTRSANVGSFIGAGEQPVGDRQADVERTNANSFNGNGLNEQIDPKRTNNGSPISLKRNPLTGTRAHPRAPARRTPPAPTIRLMPIHELWPVAEKRWQEHRGKPLGSLRDRDGGWFFPREWFTAVELESVPPERTP